MMRIGFNCDQYGNDTQFQRDLDTVAALAPGTLIRIDAVDEYITRSNGTYDWTDLDRRIGRVTDRDLGVHLMVPYWTPGNGKNQPEDQPTIDDHVAFCEALGLRYKRVVTSAELGNEANNKGGGGDASFAPDGAKPVLQGKIAVQVAAVLPRRWTIVSMGLAPASTGSGSMSPLDYVKGGYWKVAGEIFDACGVHPYGRASDANQSWSVLGQIPKMYRFTGVPMWATEYNGWAPSTGDYDTTNGVWVEQTLPWLSKLKAGAPFRKYVAWTFMYAMSDPGTEGAGQPHLGLLDGSGNPRASYAAVADYLAE